MEATIPIDSNGNYSLPTGYLAVTGQKVLASQHNPPLEDLAAAVNAMFLRSGTAPMLGNLNLNAFKIINLSPSTEAGNAVEHSQLLDVLSKITAASLPTGMRASFMRYDAPAGWIKGNGGTIGNGASGATTRANPDTEALFTLFWSNFSNSVLPIFNPDGSVSSRGATAATDYAANKRLQIFDFRSRFDRAADDGLGFNVGLVPGTTQSDSVGPHKHTLPRTSIDTSGVSVVHSVGTAAGTIATSSTDPSIDAETRPRNVVSLHCIKL